MSLKKSGLWCDLCKVLIIGGWWHIKIGIKRWPGHACETCFGKHATKDNVHSDEAREALEDD